MSSTDNVRFEEVRNGREVLIRCEGVCSSTYNHPLWIAKMRAAGYSPEDVRANISSLLKERKHKHTKRVVLINEREAHLLFACTTCGHERQYGVEEL